MQANRWPEIRTRLAAIVGEVNCLAEPEEIAPYCEDWRGLRRGAARLVVRPASTAEAAAVVRLCAEHRVAIVPQGGNTSLVAGATPSAAGDQLVLSLGRMTRVRDLDAANLTLTAEAGLTLQAAQEAASAQDCMLPLSMASEGSAQIGGALSTNAGGNYTVRYGNMRERVLGLEVVLPDGAIWNGLRRLRKDNTGYCLRQLFVGAEGTLGIITAAVLKLEPRPREIETAFCAVPSEQAALELFFLCRQRHPGALRAFEYICGEGVELVLRQISGTQFPLGSRAPHYALLELAESGAAAGLRQRLEATLEIAVDRELILDAALASSASERAALWRLREEQSEAQRREAASIKNDVSVPVSRVAAFLRRARAECEEKFPGIRVLPFGHLGDGGIHFNLLLPDGAGEATAARQSELMDVVNAVVRDFEGSFSAEHGIGTLKTAMLDEWREEPELAVMRRIKAALDPLGIMNPGKLLR